MTLDGQIVFILCVLFVSALIRSIFGFGDALISMPILALVLDLKTATPLVAFVAYTIGLFILCPTWRQIQFKSTGRLVLASLIGLPFGLYGLSEIHESLIKIALACVICGFSVYRLFTPISWTLKTEKGSYLFGFLAGVFGGACNISGPPIVIYGSLRGWSQTSFRATLQGYFIPTGLFILLGHYASGLWTRPVLSLYLLALPVVIIAICLGNVLHYRIPHTRFIRYIYILLFAVGLFLFITNIGQNW